MEGSSIPTCCALLGFTKQAYYKQCKVAAQASLNEDLILQAVCRVRAEQPMLGGRKLYYLLCATLPREVMPGRDAFFALLSVYGLLIRRKRVSKPTTTCSWHRFHTYPNLYKGRLPSAPNMVWVADITYIRMADDSFLYLSLLTDVYSHAIVGWYLSESLDMNGPLEALKMALKRLPEVHTLMHHSDRGVQYCSHAYIELLRSNGIQISMTENGDPKENAVAERVNGILKDEWLNRESIGSLTQGRELVARVIKVYNNKRPHLSNNYLTPAQADKQTGPLKRKWKSYYKKRENMEIKM
jgi:transposase InsO family protein